MSAEWEDVGDLNDTLKRIEVPGGWLYQLKHYDGMAFVPRPAEIVEATFVPKPAGARSVTRAELEEAILNNPGGGQFRPKRHRQCGGCMHQLKPVGWPTWGCSQFQALQSHDLQEWWDAFVCPDEDEWPECPVRTDAPF